MLLSLIELSRETSSDKRREFLQNITNVFVEGAEHHSDREIVLFGDILARMLDKVPEADRVELSMNVARVDQTPRSLALKLASDVSEVAAPVLEFSNALTTEDLVTLASNQGQDHLLAISRRRSLSEDVTDVIVERGESRVLNTVARNAGAKFSETGFSTLADKAKADATIGESLSQRTDLPAHVVAAILPVLNPTSRRRLEQLVQASPEQFTELFDQAAESFNVERGNIRRERLEAKVALADIRSGRRRLDEALDQFIFEKRMADIAHLLAGVAQLPEAHVSNVLHKVNATGIALVCRTIDIPATTYGRLSELRCEKLRLPVSQAEQMLRDYAEVDKSSADRVIRFHKVRTSVAAG